MKKMTCFILFALIMCSVPAFAVDHAAEEAKYEKFNLWTDLAPGEPASTEKPVMLVRKPAEKKTDACLIIFPGGGYQMLAIDHEGYKISDFFNEKGMTTVIVKYRVPRREGVPKHQPAWQDAQRAVKFVRANAEKWGINPEKIGCMGFSAGGHLTLMTSTTSQTPAYEGTEELDKTPCHVNFAVPVYPAYVLEDGNNGPNSGKGNDSTMVKDFAFDAKTPPMCLIHGDTDAYSPMNSVAVYHKLRTMNLPGELHIYAKVPHGFGARPVGQNDHEGDWLNRVYAWLKAVGM